MTTTGDFTEIPVVDMAPWRGDDGARAAFADDVRDICHNVGFMVLTGHGIDPGMVADVFALSEKFFALPEDQKRLIDKRQSRHFRGWEPVGAEYTNNRPDMREQIDLWSEHTPRPADSEPAYLRLLGPNQWPPEEIAPGFHAALDRWFSEMGALADDLMGVFATGLGLEQDHFKKLFGNECMSLTKLITYPETPPGQFGVNAHHDAGFLTILAPGETPGLEVENAAGDWVPVPLIPGSFVLNLGEVLQAMTGNYFIATPHRVVTRVPRRACGYFHGPSLDMSIAPLDLAPHFHQAVAASPRHAAAGFMAQAKETDSGIADMQSQHHPNIYGDQLWNYFLRSYPENARLHYPEAVAP